MREALELYSGLGASGDDLQQACARILAANFGRELPVGVRTIGRAVSEAASTGMSPQRRRAAVLDGYLMLACSGCIDLSRSEFRLLALLVDTSRVACTLAPGMTTRRAHATAGLDAGSYRSARNSLSARGVVGHEVLASGRGDLFRLRWSPAFLPPAVSSDVRFSSQVPDVASWSQILDLPVLIPRSGAEENPPSSFLMSVGLRERVDLFRCLSHPALWIRPDREGDGRVRALDSRLLARVYLTSHPVSTDAVAATFGISVRHARTGLSDLAQAGLVASGSDGWVPCQSIDDLPRAIEVLGASIGAEGVVRRRQERARHERDEWRTKRKRLAAGRRLAEAKGALAARVEFSGSDLPPLDVWDGFA
jgi:hypothetical protein